ncbi:MAG: hypothetical protein Q8R58_00125 [Sulfuricurvum sp.]|jgi:hypothetical protein|nr:hypothetical protein [Sulfuricurvum sp.]
MFSEIKIKTYSALLGLTPSELDDFMRRYKSYLLTQKVITKSVLINGLFILEKIHAEKWLIASEKVKLKTKNITIIRYSEKIVELYKSGMGTAKIVNHLKLNHRVTISKSALDRFITANRIKRD